MSLLPDSIERYRKFLSFIIKYWNSDVMKTATANAMSDAEKEADEEKHYNAPEELVADLKEMGPTYVKLGQLLSTRPDLLPDAYLEALSSLQDDVEAISFSEIQQIVEDELGVRISKAFQQFDEEPLASASIGQVHKAVLQSGKTVAVKIQRPGIRKKFIEDLDTIKSMTNLAVKHSKMAEKYALDDVVDELEHILLQELDYRREADNLITLGKNLKKFKKIIIPQPVKDYSTAKVLTMDYIDGKKITRITPFEKMETDFKPVIDELVEAYLQQVVVDGFAHADPHPGNVHITRDNLVSLMDLGMVAKFSPDMQEHLLKLLIGISQQNGDAITEELLVISAYNEEADIDTFRKKINRMVLDSQNTKASNMQTGRLLIQINRVAADEGIKIFVELNILGKILLNLDQIIATLTPDYDFQKAVRRYVESIMQRKMVKELKPENMFAMFLESKRLTENLPQRLNKITEKLANNDFEIKINAIDEKRITDGFQKVANRITLGLVIAAMIIGAAMMMRIPTTFTILGYPGVAILFFLLAALAGIILAYTIIFRDENFKTKK